jgi:hypothetical protein
MRERHEPHGAAQPDKRVAGRRFAAPTREMFRTTEDVGVDLNP